MMESMHTQRMRAHLFETEIRTDPSAHSTFGRLDQVAGKLPYGSTLTYKERLAIKNASPYDYNSIYAGSSQRVVGRLMQDASVRRTIPKKDFQPECSSIYRPTLMSGHARNNNFIQPGLRVAQESAGSLDPPVESLHPITFKRYMAAYPMDFMSAIRPDCRTTNQTLRMMGTYATDTLFADRMGVFIPHGIIPTRTTSAGTGYHSDVKLKTTFNRHNSFLDRTQ